MCQCQNKLYASISLNKAANVPYWCNSLSAYNDAPPKGYLTLNNDLFKQPVPISAKYSLRLLQNDLISNQAKPLDYYGTVLSLNGKVIKYDPALMGGSVTSYTPDSGTSVPAPGTQNTGSTGDLLNTAKDVAKQHPLAVSAGLVLLMFGMGTLLSSK